MLVVFGAKSLRSLDSLQLPFYNFSGVITDVETAMAFENVPFLRAPRSALLEPLVTATAEYATNMQRYCDTVASGY
jgi:hypothetical protein